MYFAKPSRLEFHYPTEHLQLRMYIATLLSSSNGTFPEVKGGVWFDQVADLGRLVESDVQLKKMDARASCAYART